MNDLLKKAEKWFAELEIPTQEAVNCLLVSRDGVANFGPANSINIDVEILGELRSAFGTNKFYWSFKDDNWLHLETF